jgi:hypothetical protein
MAVVLFSNHSAEPAPRSQAQDGQHDHAVAANLPSR